MQKNSICIDTEQRYVCRILHFNRQNLMFTKPPNDWVTACGTNRIFPIVHRDLLIFFHHFVRLIIKGGLDFFISLLY